jgi:hypothetical protein
MYKGKRSCGPPSVRRWVWRSRLPLDGSRHGGGPVHHGFRSLCDRLLRCSLPRAKPNGLVAPALAATSNLRSGERHHGTSLSHCPSHAQQWAVWKRLGPSAAALPDTQSAGWSSWPAVFFGVGDWANSRSNSRQTWRRARSRSGLCGAVINDALATGRIENCDRH